MDFEHLLMPVMWPVAVNGFLRMCVVLAQRLLKNPIWCVYKLYALASVERVFPLAGPSHIFEVPSLNGDSIVS